MIRAPGDRLASLLAGSAARGVESDPVFDDSFVPRAPRGLAFMSQLALGAPCFVGVVAGCSKARDAVAGAGVGAVAGAGPGAGTGATVGVGVGLGAGLGAGAGACAGGPGVASGGARVGTRSSGVVAAAVAPAAPTYIGAFLRHVALDFLEDDQTSRAAQARRSWEVVVNLASACAERDAAFRRLLELHDNVRAPVEGVFLAASEPISDETSSAPKKCLVGISAIGAAAGAASGETLISSAAQFGAQLAAPQTDVMTASSTGDLTNSRRFVSADAAALLARRALAARSLLREFMQGVLKISEPAPAAVISGSFEKMDDSAGQNSSPQKSPGISRRVDSIAQDTGRACVHAVPEAPQAETLSFDVADAIVRHTSAMLRDVIILPPTVRRPRPGASPAPAAVTSDAPKPRVCGLTRDSAALLTRLSAVYPYFNPTTVRGAGFSATHTGPARPPSRPPAPSSAALLSAPSGAPPSSLPHDSIRSLNIAEDAQFLALRSKLARLAPAALAAYPFDFAPPRRTPSGAPHCRLPDAVPRSECALNARPHASLVSCGTCGAWLHIVCAGVTESSAPLRHPLPACAACASVQFGAALERISAAERASSNDLAASIAFCSAVIWASGSMLLGVVSRSTRGLMPLRALAAETVARRAASVQPPVDGDSDAPPLETPVDFSSFACEAAHALDMASPAALRSRLASPPGAAPGAAAARSWAVARTVAFCLLGGDVNTTALTTQARESSGGYFARLLTLALSDMRVDGSGSKPARGAVSDYAVAAQCESPLILDQSRIAALPSSVDSQRVDFFLGPIYTTESGAASEGAGSADDTATQLSSFAQCILGITPTAPVQQLADAVGLLFCDSDEANVSGMPLTADASVPPQSPPQSIAQAWVEAVTPRVISLDAPTRLCSMLYLQSPPLSEQATTPPSARIVLRESLRVLWQALSVSERDWWTTLVSLRFPSSVNVDGSETSATVAAALKIVRDSAGARDVAAPLFQQGRLPLLDALAVGFDVTGPTPTPSVVASGARVMPRIIQFGSLAGTDAASVVGKVFDATRPQRGGGGAAGGAAADEVVNDFRDRDADAQGGGGDEPMGSTSAGSELAARPPAPKTARAAGIEVGAVWNVYNEAAVLLFAPPPPGAVAAQPVRPAERTVPPGSAPYISQWTRLRLVPLEREPHDGGGGGAAAIEPPPAAATLRKSERGRADVAALDVLSSSFSSIDSRVGGRPDDWSALVRAQPVSARAPRDWWRVASASVGAAALPQTEYASSGKDDDIPDASSLAALLARAAAGGAASASKQNEGGGGNSVRVCAAAPACRATPRPDSAYCSGACGLRAARARAAAALALASAESSEPVESGRAGGGRGHLCRRDYEHAAAAGSVK